MFLTETANKRHSILIVLLVCGLLWCVSERNPAGSQQAEIAIVLPTAASGVSDGNVQYARSVA